MNSPHFDTDQTLHLYQTLADWLAAVEDRYEKPLADRCRQHIKKLGFLETDFVSDLPQRPDQIIAEAQSRPT